MKVDAAQRQAEGEEHGNQEELSLGNANHRCLGVGRRTWATKRSHGGDANIARWFLGGSPRANLREGGSAEIVEMWNSPREGGLIFHNFGGAPPAECCAKFEVGLGFMPEICARGDACPARETVFL
jgi:hypothetical protein